MTYHNAEKMATLLLLVCLTIFLLTIFHINRSLNISNYNVTININTSWVVQTVDKRFLSVTLDSNVIRKHWETLDLRSKKVLVLAKGLSPAYLRVGGNDADRLIFNESSITSMNNRATEKEVSNFSISTLDWDKLNQFAQIVKWKLIFDLNVLLRTVNNAWNSTNAESLLQYSLEKKYFMDFQLGNEPNNFPHEFGINLTGETLAEDYKQLRILQIKYPYFKSSLLIGPEVTRPNIKFSEVESPSLPYIRQFLQHVGNNVDIISWHQYYFDGRIAKKDDFIDPYYFNLFAMQIESVNSLVKELGFNNTIWLTETSTGYGGGTPLLSNRYAAIFLWLDKLGISAKHGIKMVARQSFYGNNYGLIDKDIDPLPDYWISLLYKKTVGQKVLNVTKHIHKEESKIRVYAHCSSLEYSKGSVTLFFINLFQTSLSFQIKGLLETIELLDEYLITSLEPSLHCKYVQLNGEKLDLINDTILPDLKPRKIDPHQGIQIPPLSVGFYVFVDANVQICL